VWRQSHPNASFASPRANSSTPLSDTLRFHQRLTLELSKPIALAAFVNVSRLRGRRPQGAAASSIKEAMLNFRRFTTQENPLHALFHPNLVDCRFCLEASHTALFPMCRSTGLAARRRETRKVTWFPMRLF
jgi:hypothetical protein